MGESAYTGTWARQAGQGEQGKAGWQGKVGGQGGHCRASQARDRKLLKYSEKPVQTYKAQKCEM